MNRRGRCTSRGERGAVTAELALGLPVLLAVTLALTWLLQVVALQVRVVDAAREAARAVARGDPPAEATRIATHIAPDGAHVSITERDGWITVQVRARASPPGGALIAGLGVTLDSEAVALAEEP